MNEPESPTTLLPCPFCGAPETPLTGNNWARIKHDADCFLAQIAQRDMMIRCDQFSAWSRRTASVGADAAEICAEMAREAATIAARHASNFRESGNDVDANLKECHEARAAALREAERRIRASKGEPAESSSTELRD